MGASEIRVIVSVTGGVVDSVRADSPKIRLSVLDLDSLEEPDESMQSLEAEFYKLPFEVN